MEGGGLKYGDGGFMVKDRGLRMEGGGLWMGN